jgi:hypothetical protein
MSTYERYLDRIAEQQRKQERQAAKDETRLQDVARFVISILANKRLPNDIARRTALDALRTKEIDLEMAEADAETSRPLAECRMHATLLEMGEAIAAGLPPDAMRLPFCELADALEAYQEQYSRWPPAPWRWCAERRGKHENDNSAESARSRSPMSEPPGDRE